MSNWVVYILRCADNSLYTGISNDIKRRIYEHNHDDKKSSKYTRSRRPVELVYQETGFNHSTASQREYAIKQLSRQQKLTLINNANNQT